MTATPPSFAGPPAIAGDLLSQALRAVRVSAGAYLNGTFTEPFGVVDPRSYDERTPMGRMRQVSVLHLLLEGACDFEAEGARFRVEAGDLIFHARPGPYRFVGGQPGRFVDAREIVRAGPVDGMWVIVHGGGGPAVRMVCGFVESADFMFAPLFGGRLPSVIVEPTADDHAGALMTSTAAAVAEQVARAAPGAEAVLARLMELLFVELLRRHVVRLPEGSVGWLAALKDPVVARVLALLHSDPAHHWTIDELATRVGSSRTVLHQRFTLLVGRPPMHYLVGWRMQLAAEQLATGDDAIARVAARVGYESEAAFNRAFRRTTGVAPGRWRDAARG